MVATTMETPDLSKLNLSPEEAKKMTKLMKDPKFMEMFVDYAKEISDPKNREEMENALKQAEERGEKVPGFPEGKELLVPVAVFCAKTKNEETGMKVFINICHSDKIKKASGKERPDKSGTEWDVPYSLAPPINATDKGGAECDVHDFCVNTGTLNLALDTFQFKKFIVETAIDAVEKQRHVKLSRDFILPRLKYKGSSGEPRMLTISKFPTSSTPPSTEKRATGKKMQASATKVSSSCSTPGSRSNNSTPGASCDPSNVRENYEVNPQSMQENLTSKCPEKTSRSCESITEADSSSLAKLSSAVITNWTENDPGRSAQEVEPKYKVVYRNHLDLTQFWEDKANIKVGKDEVKEILLHVHLPGVVDLAEIKLDVVQTEVLVVVPKKFKLQVRLNYQIDTERGQAKFDKEKLLYQLEVTLPVIKYQPRLEHDEKTLSM